MNNGVQSVKLYDPKIESLNVETITAVMRKQGYGSHNEALRHIQTQRMRHASSAGINRVFLEVKNGGFTDWNHVATDAIENDMAVVAGTSWQTNGCIYQHYGFAERMREVDAQAVVSGAINSSSTTIRESLRRISVPNKRVVLGTASTDDARNGIEMECQEEHAVDIARAATEEGIQVIEIADWASVLQPERIPDLVGGLRDAVGQQTQICIQPATWKTGSYDNALSVARASIAAGVDEIGCTARNTSLLRCSDVQSMSATEYRELCYA